MGSRNFPSEMPEATKKYEALIHGKRRIVTVGGHGGGDDILPKTLASMVRQSGLSKKLFR